MQEDFCTDPLPSPSVRCPKCHESTNAGTHRLPVISAKSVEFIVADKKIPIRIEQLFVETIEGEQGPIAEASERSVNSVWLPPEGLQQRLERVEVFSYQFLLEYTDQICEPKVSRCITIIFVAT